MIRQRLINCDFLNASTFLKLSNKAKLLYYSMITNADDLGFVDTLDTIIKNLVRFDDGYEQAKMLGLQDQLENDYLNAKIELLTKTYLYLFTDKHNNEIFVIKHWFKHNRYKYGLRTNYDTFYKQLELENGEYYLKKEYKKPLKENKEKESKTKGNKEEDLVEETKLETSNDSVDKKEWDDTLKELEEMNNYIDESEED